MLTGCGIDLAEINRFSNLDEKLVAKLFSPSEIKEAEEFKTGGAKASFFASRFAAKEALVKALGTGFRGIVPAQITVAEDEFGKPFFLFPAALEAKVTGLTILLSLTHEGLYAAAMVVIDGAL